jgi:hypothetical protein
MDNLSELIIKALPRYIGEVKDFKGKSVESLVTYSLVAKKEYSPAKVERILEKISIVVLGGNLPEQVSRMRTFIL